MTEPEQRSVPDRARKLLFGRRKGPKLSAHQAGLRAGLLPRLALQLVAGADPKSYFDGVEEVWLEVGFGAGEHLDWQARNNPRVGLIGAEPYEMGTAKLLSKIEAAPLANIRLYEGDGRDIIEALPDASLGRFFLLFPDPWPKTRHHKRRFLQSEMLDGLARVLKPGAELRFATDDKSYLPFALERIVRHPAFDWQVLGSADWKTRPADWPPTRYETKAIKGPPTFLRVVRNAKMAA